MLARALGAPSGTSTKGLIMVRIITVRRHGLQVYRAMLLIEGRVYREAYHMSEAGARTWVARQLQDLGAHVERAA